MYYFKGTLLNLHFIEEELTHYDIVCSSKRWTFSQILFLGCVLILSARFFLANTCKRKSSYPPGPPLTPLIGNLLIFASNDILQTLKDLRREYGDIFSLCIRNKVVVVVNGLDNIKEVFVKRGDVTSKRPDTFFFNDCLQRSGEF